MKVAGQQWFLVVLFSISLLMIGSTLAGGELRNASTRASSAPQEKPGNKSNSVGDPAKGKAVFEENCEFCHNADSDEALVGPGLKNLFHWPPHKLSDGTEHKEHTVAIIRKQIVEGGGAMDAVGASFSDQEVNDLIAYLQTL